MSEYAPERVAEDEPTQVQQPVQAAKRTVLQFVAGVLTTLTISGLLRIGLEVPADVAQAIGVLMGAAVSWAMAWIMALPRVNALLTGFSLGATPKS